MVVTDEYWHITSFQLWRKVLGVFNVKILSVLFPPLSRAHISAIFGDHLKVYVIRLVLYTYANNLKVKLSLLPLVRSSWSW